MKHVFLSLIAFTALTAFAQEAEVQSGTPALLEAANGKKASVFLQKLADGKLTFQPAKSSNGMTVPADKIKSLKFAMSKEEFDSCREKNLITSEQIKEVFDTPDLGNAEKLELIFGVILDNIAAFSYEGDYAGYVSGIEPFMSERGQYMAIDNNLVRFYIMLMESYRNLGNSSKAMACAKLLSESSDENTVQAAKATLALLAIAASDIESAEAIRSELTSEAGSLYLKASILRAQGEFKEAMKNVTLIIADHANDQNWMPQSELLSAYLYLDMTGTNSVISTNSVINTARQVKNIYAGSGVGGEARQLWAGLGGEAIEEAENLAKAERAAAEQKVKAEREARKERERLEKKAQREAEAAAKAAAASTNSTTSTETQSE